MSCLHYITTTITLERDRGLRSLTPAGWFYWRAGTYTVIHATPGTSELFTLNTAKQNVYAHLLRQNAFYAAEDLTE